MSEQNPMEYNGGCVIAMTGKNCVAIAADRRFGIRNNVRFLLYECKATNEMICADHRNKYAKNMSSQRSSDDWNVWSCHGYTDTSRKN